MTLANTLAINDSITLEIWFKRSRLSLVMVANDKNGTKPYSSCWLSLKQLENLSTNLKLAASLANWKSLELREADSLKSDYFEAYDSKRDTNYYLKLTDYGKENSEFVLQIDGYFFTPNKHSVGYNFKKRKLESFLFDLYTYIERGKQYDND